MLMFRHLLHTIRKIHQCHYEKIGKDFSRKIHETPYFLVLMA